MVLLVDPGSPEANELAEPLLNEAVERFPDQVNILNLIGAVRHLQSRHEDALAVYKIALATDPESVLTLNNVATLYSEMPNSLDRAVQTIDRAFEIDPANRGLMDTRAMVMLYSGRAEEARDALKKIAAAFGADARNRFHLAAAEYELDNLEEAQRLLEEAIDDKLLLGVLTPREWQIFNKLQSSLRGNPDQTRNAPERRGQDLSERSSAA